MVTGANGRFSGGFDISAFPKMQEGGKFQKNIYSKNVVEEFRSLVFFRCGVRVSVRIQISIDIFRLYSVL